jgi:IS5 family transposase
MSDDHFTVDGTVIEAWASLKSFGPKGEDRSGDDDQGDPGNGWVDFHGEKRSNDTHESSTDPDSPLMRKGPGQEAKLGYGAHALMKNRNGLLVDLLVSQGAGSAERAAAEKMIKRQRQKGVKVKSLGADKGYDTQDFVKFLRRRKILPHVAANTRRRDGSAIDDRTTRHQSYGVSQRIRKRVEEILAG